MYDRKLWRVKAQFFQSTAALCLALFLCTPKLNSTTVIAFVRHDRIVIAADAKSSITKGDGFQFVKTCKIYQTGSSFVAFIGMDEDDNLGGFTSSDIARKNILLTVQGHAEAFAEEAKGPFLKSMQRAYQVASLNVAARKQYQFEFGGRVPLVALFLGIEQGASVFESIDMVKVEDAHGRPVGVDVEKHSCPGDGCPEAGRVRTLWAGHVDAARAEYKRMEALHDPRLEDDVVTLRHLVEIEITAVPHEVGPPVAVLLIDAAGGHWIIDGECGPSAHKPKPQSKPKKPTGH
jgi:hypothetical protein